MKKSIFALILTLFVVSGFVYANNEIIGETPAKNAKKVWEATPEGIAFKKWEASSAGKKVYAGEAKIRKSIREFSNMNAVVTSLTLPQGSRLGYGIMVNINGEDYILAFGVESKNEFDQLRKLKVNDKINIKSRNVSHAPKYAYPIVAGDNIERNGKLIYKRVVGKGGC
ncbi:MAG: hypothetical protein RI940_1338 [Bacteroidota bacterium]|jgi:hypothetical protein